jgi:pimeloyl-ACP methyl ester carboxylesterase
LPPPDAALPDSVNDALRAWYARPETWRLLGNEHDCRYGASSDEVLAIQRGLGDIPICALLAGRRTWDLLSAEDGSKLLAIWQGMQKEFAQRSTRGTWRVVPDCGHAIPSERPDAVIAAIREIAAMSR